MRELDQLEVLLKKYPECFTEYGKRAIKEFIEMDKYAKEIFAGLSKNE